MKLSEADIIALVPRFMSEDYFNRMLAAVMTDPTRYAAAGIQLVTKWDKIDELSENALDKLAKELDISWYLPQASIERKRKIIKTSDIIHTEFGTKTALKKVIDIYFNDSPTISETNIIEWFDPAFDGTAVDKDPLYYERLKGTAYCYYFYITTTNLNITSDTMSDFLTVVSKIKSLRSHMVYVFLKIDAQAAVVAENYMCMKHSGSGTVPIVNTSAITPSSSVICGGAYTGDCQNVLGVAAEPANFTLNVVNLDVFNKTSVFVDGADCDLTINGVSYGTKRTDVGGNAAITGYSAMQESGRKIYGNLTISKTGYFDTTFSNVSLQRRWDDTYYIGEVNPSLVIIASARGYVTDSSDNPIAGARVYFSGHSNPLGTAPTYEVYTDTNGQYNIPNMQGMKYSLDVRHDDYNTYETNYGGEVMGNPTTINFTLSNG